MGWWLLVLFSDGTWDMRGPFEQDECKEYALLIQKHVASAVKIFCMPEIASI